MTRSLSRSAITGAAIAGAALAALTLTARAISHAPAPPRPPIPAPALDDVTRTPGATVSAVLAGGCFWGMEAVFEHVRGVTSVTSGYAGGSGPAPTYEQVSTGTTGYAESVRITYDPSQVSYGELLQVFFTVAHDPTQRDRQGPDVGPQYRSVIFYTTETERRVARAYIDQLTQAKVFSRPIVTEVVPLRSFHPAEAYHQDYAAHHPDDPYIVINDLPKVEHLRRALPRLYRATITP